MTTTPSTNNPFDLPELIQHFSKFVSTKDAPACALVSKAWTYIFTSAVWSKVDYGAHPRFVHLALDTITKHGHRIRVVKNASSFPQVVALANPNVNKLRCLHIRATATPLLQIRTYEIVFRNCTTLQDLHLFATTSSLDRHTYLANYVLTSAFVRLSALSSPGPSRIRMLKIEQLCLTHDRLIEILQGCPMLSDLRLPYTDVVGTPTQSFQHSGIRFFASDLKNLFGSNNAPRPTAFSWWIVPAAGSHPSLLSHFPNLVTLSVCDYTVKSTIPSVEIKEAILQHCPCLTGFHLEDITGAIVVDFLNNIADKVSQLVFRHNNMSMEMIRSIILHQHSLKAIMHFNMHPDFNFEDDKVAPTSTHFRASGDYLQLIPRKCSQLRVLDLHFHEMGMDAVERGEWTCKGLKTLRIRVKGLDTKEKILQAIGLWRAGCRRRWGRQGAKVTIDVDEQDKNDLSIEACVARHLLKFEKLWWVWLGYQTWTPI